MAEVQHSVGAMNSRIKEEGSFKLTYWKSGTGSTGEPRLYFMSDRPGGSHGMDIFEVVKEVSDWAECPLGRKQTSVSGRKQKLT